MAACSYSIENSNDFTNRLKFFPDFRTSIEISWASTKSISLSNFVTKSDENRTKNICTSPIRPNQNVSVDSLDNAHGFSGHCPLNQWTVWTMSMDSVDKVQGVLADWTISMDFVH